MPNSLKQSLMDFQKEMKSQLLEDTFEVRGKRWTMRLLNEEETLWATSMMNTSTIVTSAVSAQLAHLAMGIREIDGSPIYEYFTEDWDKLEDRERAALLEMNRYALKYFVAEHMHSFLAEMPPEVTNDLWECWNKLLERREDAQAMAKKSSGETSQQASSES